MTKKVSKVPNPDELVLELCHIEPPEDLFPGIFLKEAATYRPPITARATFGCILPGSDEKILDCQLMGGAIPTLELAKGQ